MAGYRCGCMAETEASDWKTAERAVRQSHLQKEAARICHFDLSKMSDHDHILC